MTDWAKQPRPGLAYGVGGKPRTAGKESYPRVEVHNRAQLRQWLAANASRDIPIWLVHYKKHSGDRYIAYSDIVDDLLCFGWIDSTARRVDEDRMTHMIAPRRAGSMWSIINKNKIKRLIETRLMMPAGLAVVERAKADGSWTLLDDVEALIVPNDLKVALASRPAARSNYHDFPASAKKGLLWWIKSAKRDTTRAARIERTVEQAARNKVANQPDLMKPKERS